MKYLYYLIFTVSLSLNVVFAQRAVLHTITNFNVDTTADKFSFDIYSLSTGTPTIRVGITSYYLNYNNLALITPVLSNINPKFTTGSPTGDYNAMTVQIALGKIAVSIIYSGNGDGTGDFLSTTLPNGERICTVTLNITPQGQQGLTAMLNWDTINSAMQAAGLQAVTNSYTGSFDDPQPVELSAFQVKYNGKGKVDLNWVTKTEVNNYGFYVERRISESEWNSITFIEGHGNSNSPKEYSYEDKDLFAGGTKFQYRLKQVDTDGKFEYSDVVEVEIVPTEFELSQNYPNPFNPSTTIRFSLPKQTQLKLSLYNMLGEFVETLAEGTYDVGYHKVVVNASDLSSGMYVYRIESNDFVQTKKMMLLK
jgi:hypothetical protein